ncbi:hypothetical protein O5O45_20380 [Hahella aquimaris]|uniref:hypothetical protein n=1 Tax=Hahella sp. HNIBRBA332 TaxID=3015983 RepID=UPI00273B05A1|nr:hypothetical protein [Hahella sp. HNIBRBA332]WLQ12085.1 hypothetical protein O5O45_20380 [Hahella sp. HNIBRBA332]
MELSVKLIDGFSYSASGSKFPLEIIISSDDVMLIDENVSVNRLELCSLNVEFLSFGINRMITSKKTNAIELSPRKPYRKIIDLMDEGNLDEEDEVLEGEYVIKASVTVMAYNDAGLVEAKFIELGRKVTVSVTK